MRPGRLGMRARPKPQGISVSGRAFAGWVGPPREGDALHGGDSARAHMPLPIISSQLKTLTELS